MGHQRLPVQGLGDPVLVPALRPGDILVLDSRGSHKGVAVRRALRDAGAHLLFPPRYSPDLNPIEMLFAKLKRLLRNPTNAHSRPSYTSRLGF